MRHLIILSLLVLSTSAAVAESRDSQVRRSVSGGSASADTITIRTDDTSSADETARAQLKLKEESAEKSSKTPRTVRRSFSGGAGSADQIALEKR